MTLKATHILDGESTVDECIFTSCLIAAPPTRVSNDYTHSAYQPPDSRGSASRDSETNSCNMTSELSIDFGSEEVHAIETVDLQHSCLN